MMDCDKSIEKEKLEGGYEQEEKSRERERTGV